MLVDIALALETAHTPGRDPRRRDVQPVYANVRPAANLQETSVVSGTIWTVLQPAPVRRITAIIDEEVKTFDSIEEKYIALAKEWRRFNRGKSIINYAHYAYLQVVALGWSAVPFMLRDVASGAGTWYLALQYITGERPESPAARGNAEAVREAWLEWGRRNGYSGQPENSQRND